MKILNKPVLYSLFTNNQDWNYDRNLINILILFLWEFGGSFNLESEKWNIEHSKDESIWTTVFIILFLLALFKEQGYKIIHGRTCAIFRLGSGTPWWVHQFLTQFFRSVSITPLFFTWEVKRYTITDIFSKLPT